MGADFPQSSVAGAVGAGHGHAVGGAAVVSAGPKRGSFVLGGDLEQP